MHLDKIKVYSFLHFFFNSITYNSKYKHLDTKKIEKLSKNLCNTAKRNPYSTQHAFSSDTIIIRVTHFRHVHLYIWEYDYMNCVTVWVGVCVSVFGRQ